MRCISGLFTLLPIYITVSTRHVVRRFSSFLKNSPQKNVSAKFKQILIPYLNVNKYTFEMIIRSCLNGVLLHCPKPWQKFNLPAF